MSVNSIYDRHYNVFSSTLKVNKAESKTPQTYTQTTPTPRHTPTQQPKLTAKDIEAALGMTAEESLALLDEKMKMRQELWDNEFDEWFNSDISALKEAAQGKAVSIFDTEDISAEVRAFLKDKPVTAVRYQRLYEQDTAKADMFIKNIMKNGNNFVMGLDDVVDLDAKYQGQDYLQVLEHINALLEKNIKDNENGFTSFSNVYQRLFDLDDGIGTDYQEMKLTDTPREIQIGDITVSDKYTTEIQRPGSDVWESIPNGYRDSVTEMVRTESGGHALRSYLQLYKPIGRGENGTVLGNQKNQKGANQPISDNSLFFFGGRPESFNKYMSNFSTYHNIY